MASFQHYTDWKFHYRADLKGKIYITSASASLDQILPWMFYHKVIGVSNVFSFVEEDLHLFMFLNPRVNNSGSREDMHAIMVFLPSNLLIWRWPLSWQRKLAWTG